MGIISACLSASLQKLGTPMRYANIRDLDEIPGEIYQQPLQNGQMIKAFRSKVLYLTLQQIVNR